MSLNFPCFRNALLVHRTHDAAPDVPDMTSRLEQRGAFALICMAMIALALLAHWLVTAFGAPAG